MASDMRENEEGWCLSLMGQTSTGKTMIGNRLLSFAKNLAACKPRYYVGEPPPAPSKIYWPKHVWSQVEELTFATFLFVDEIARGDRGGAEWRRLMDLLTMRVERRLFTVITSNLTFEELRKIDPSVASRLRRNGGVVIQAGGAVRPFEDRK